MSRATKAVLSTTRSQRPQETAPLPVPLLKTLKGVVDDRQELYGEAIARVHSVGRLSQDGAGISITVEATRDSAGYSDLYVTLEDYGCDTGMQWEKSIALENVSPDALERMGLAIVHAVALARQMGLAPASSAKR